MKEDPNRILYFILNWGLGHATRSIPIIRALRENGHEVILVSTGRSLLLLCSEFPDCRSFDLPDYGVTYSRYAWALLPHLLGQMPRIFLRLFLEHRATGKLVRDFCPDLIISDNRYGCYSKSIPSFFIIHQLRFQLPAGLQWSSFISEWFNRMYFRHYEKVLVPDEPTQPNLSGNLSHSGRIARHQKLIFTGLLASVSASGAQINPDIDVLFLISGPEPSRTQLERRIREQAVGLGGKKVLVLGKPGDPTVEEPAESDIRVYSHLERSDLGNMLQRAKLVVCNAGYSTMMELTALRKPAILVPTPGQTEQEYLGRINHESGHFYCVSQKNLNLKKDIPLAKQFFTKSEPAFIVNRVEAVVEVLGCPVKKP